MKRPDSAQPLTLTEAIIPVAALILLVGLSYFLFGDAGALGPQSGGAGCRHDDCSLHRLAARPFGRGAGQSRDRQRGYQHRRDFYLVCRWRFDRHLGAERYFGGDGLLTVCSF